MEFERQSRQHSKADKFESSLTRKSSGARRRPPVELSPLARGDSSDSSRASSATLSPLGSSSGSLASLSSSGSSSTVLELGSMGAMGAMGALQTEDAIRAPRGLLSRYSAPPGRIDTSGAGSGAARAKTKACEEPEAPYSSSSSSTSGMSSMSCEQQQNAQPTNPRPKEQVQQVAECLGELLERVAIEQANNEQFEYTSCSFGLHEAVLAKTNSTSTTSGGSDSDEATGPAPAGRPFEELEWAAEIPEAAEVARGREQLLALARQSIASRRPASGAAAAAAWRPSGGGGGGASSPSGVEWRTGSGQLSTLELSRVLECLTSGRLVVWLYKSRKPELELELELELETTLDDIAMALDEPLTGSGASQRDQSELGAAVWLCQDELQTSRVARLFAAYLAGTSPPGHAQADLANQRAASIAEPAKRELENVSQSLEELYESAKEEGEEEVEVEVEVEAEEEGGELGAAAGRLGGVQSPLPLGRQPAAGGRESGRLRPPTSAAPTPTPAPAPRQLQLTGSGRRARISSQAQTGSRLQGKVQAPAGASSKGAVEASSGAKAGPSGGRLASYYRSVASRVLGKGSSRTKGLKEEAASPNPPLTTARRVSLALTNTKATTTTTITSRAQGAADAEPSGMAQRQEGVSGNKERPPAEEPASNRRFSKIIQAGDEPARRAPVGASDGLVGSVTRPTAKLRTSILKKNKSQLDLSTPAPAPAQSVNKSNVPTGSSRLTNSRLQPESRVVAAKSALRAPTSLAASSPRPKSILKTSKRQQPTDGAAKFELADENNNQLLAPEVAPEVRVEAKQRLAVKQQQQQRQAQEPDAISMVNSISRERAFERMRQRASCYDISRLMSKSSSLESQLSKLRPGNAGSLALSTGSRQRQRRPALLIESGPPDRKCDSTNGKLVDHDKQHKDDGGEEHGSGSDLNDDDDDGDEENKQDTIRAAPKTKRAELSAVDWSRQGSTRLSVGVPGVGVAGGAQQAKKCEFDTRSLRRLAALPSSSAGGSQAELASASASRRKSTSGARLLAGASEPEVRDSRSLLEPDSRREPPGAPFVVESNELSQPSDQEEEEDDDDDDEDDDGTESEATIEPDEQEGADEDADADADADTSELRVAMSELEPDAKQVGSSQPEARPKGKSQSGSSGFSKLSLLRQSFSQKSLSSMLRLSSRASMRLRSGPQKEAPPSDGASDASNSSSSPASRSAAAPEVAASSRQQQQLEQRQTAPIDSTALMLAAQYNRQMQQQSQHHHHQQQQQQQQQQRIFMQQQYAAMAAAMHQHQQHQQHQQQQQQQALIQRQQRQQQLAYMANFMSHHQLSSSLAAAGSAQAVAVQMAAAAAASQQLAYLGAPLMGAPGLPQAYLAAMAPAGQQLVAAAPPQPPQYHGMYQRHKSMMRGAGSGAGATQAMYPNGGQQLLQQQPPPPQHQQQQLIPMSVNHHSSFNIVYAGTSQHQLATAQGSSQANHNHSNTGHREAPTIGFHRNHSERKASTLGASMRKTVKSILINSKMSLTSSSAGGSRLITSATPGENSKISHSEGQLKERKLKSALKSPSSRDLVLNSEGSDGDGSSSDSTTTNSNVSSNNSVSLQARKGEQKSIVMLKKNSIQTSGGQRQQQQASSSADISRSSIGSITDFHIASRSNDKRAATLTKAFDYRQSARLNSHRERLASSSMSSSGRKNVTFNTKLQFCET